MRRDTLRSYAGDVLEATRQLLQMRASWRDFFSILAFLALAVLVAVLLTLRAS